MTQPLLNGTYVILSTWSQSCVSFVDNQSQPLVLDCSANSLQQEWQVQPLSSNTYSVKNLQNNSYISATANQQFSTLVQSTTPYGWYVNETATSSTGNTFVLAPNDTFSLAWNIQAPNEGNVLNLNLCCGYTGNPFLFEPIPNPISTTSPTSATPASTSLTSANSQSSSGSQPHQTWKIVVPCVVVPVGLLVLGALFYFRRSLWRRQTAPPVGPR
ncbi:hypothetical protein EV363DRAFT_1318637 [Boletus edulis]|nr:hypothetical protein EV363DRAFT_1318637 [Boletus edulis]